MYFFLSIVCSIDLQIRAISLSTTVNAWTTRGIGTPTLCTAENPHITHSRPPVYVVPLYLARTCGFKPLQMLQCRSIYYWKKSSYKWSRTVQTHVAHGLTVHEFSTRTKFSKFTTNTDKKTLWEDLNHSVHILTELYLAFLPTEDTIHICNSRK